MFPWLPLAGEKQIESLPATTFNDSQHERFIMEPTQSRLKELFDYRDDGNLIRKTKSSNVANNVKIGEVAGYLHTHKKSGKNYWRLKVDMKPNFAHRLIWIWHYGYINKQEIDHIDGNGINNKIENLRLATHAENTKNLKIRSTNKAGVAGVYFYKKNKNWKSAICVDGERIHLGTFDNLFSAAIARKEAEIKYFGEWARK